VLFLVLSSGCTSSDDSAGSDGLTVESTDFTEGTLASSAAPQRTTPATEAAPPVGTPAPADANAGASTARGPEDVLLRVEGAPEVRFSGLCSVGEEETVVDGRVPRRYTYSDLDGRPFTCRIQKQSGGRGNLRVILVAGETTRSVQQTNTRGGTITVSHDGR